MSDPTPPAVSDAMRDAVARYVAEGLPIATSALIADHLLHPAGPIASEIARLTGERDAAEKKLAAATETFTDDDGTVWSRPTAWAYFASCRALKRLYARAEAAEAELAKVASVVRSAAMGEWTDNYEAMVEEACAFEDRMKAAEADLTRMRAEVERCGREIEYTAARRDLWLNEAQRLAALARELGGNPEPDPHAALFSQEQADV